MEPNTRLSPPTQGGRSRLPLIALLAATTLGGCAWIHARQIARRTNPQYRTGAIPGPTRVVPIFECPHARRGVEPSARDRERFRDTVVPALWQAAGADGEPQVSSAPVRALCRELYENDTYPPWSGTPALRDAVRDLVGPGERSVLATFVAFTYQCEEKVGTVRDSTGAVIGSVGTGDEVCAENGRAHLMTYLLADDGALVWQAGIDADLADDPQALAASLFEDFPRARVALAAP